MADSRTQKTSSPLLIALAWAIVIVPTLWGLNYTAKNALKLFTKSVPAAAAPATTPGK